jgi:predicted nucleic acid-binding protein
MIVVDASVWVSILLDIDLFHRQSYLWFEEYDRFSGEMAAPSLLLPEVAAGLTRRTGDAVAGREATQYLTSLGNLYIIPIDHRLASVAAELAADYHLRGADAVYAALAYSLGVPLLSWDNQQMTRMQKVIKAGTPGILLDSNCHSIPPNREEEFRHVGS